jgi:hypothetical protein
MDSDKECQPLQEEQLSLGEGKKEEKLFPHKVVFNGLLFLL